MTPVVRREEVDPGPLRAQGPRVAVLVSLNFPGMTEHVAGLVRSFTRTALESLAEAGARHTLIDTSDHAALDDPARTAAGHDGLLLLGGGDADPALYGLTGPAPNSYGVDRRADDHSIAAIRAAVAAGRPVLGICRGSQLINLAYGGTLIPDLEDYHLHHGPPGAPCSWTRRSPCSPAPACRAWSPARA
ncbi:gamma-glutamyl-gamma-aminobutyrate hydrolase family protein [Thermocatellispora tengchongensis]|uniref:gamma-glutamyl-gamma-aminobutyrate hydrolase family protein n=1 Tax=Thermocatellispora tengchongensis TaxID=1073253 RepID=UPI0036283DC4